MMMSLRVLSVVQVCTFIGSLAGSVILSKYLMQPQPIRAIDFSLASELIASSIASQNVDNKELQAKIEETIQKFKTHLQEKAQKEKLILLPKTSVLSGVQDITKQTVEEALKGDLSQ